MLNDGTPAEGSIAYGAWNVLLYRKLKFNDKGVLKPVVKFYIGDLCALYLQWSSDVAYS